MQASEQNEQSPSMMWSVAPIAAWAGLGMADSWLRKDKFLNKHQGLYRGAAKRSGASRDAFFDQYYNKKYAKTAANVEARGVAVWTGREAASDAARVAFKSKAQTGMMKRAAAKVTGRLLGVANFLTLAPMLYGASYHGFKGIQRLGYELERPEVGSGHLSLNAYASTDRQRAIMAMHNSEFNGRSAMGQEAFLYHR